MTKKMKRTFVLLLMVLTAISCSTKIELADYINTSIGVIDDRGSNCVIGPQLPYGSILPSPETPHGGMDGYDPEKPIRGFAQLHVSGTGWSTYGHFLVSPMTGVDTGLKSHDSPHSSDITKAYYYSTHLDRYDITTEIAPSYYSAIYRFTFPETDSACVLLDAAQGIASDIAPEIRGKVLDCEASCDIESGKVQAMLRYVGGWPEQPYTMWFVGKFDRTITSSDKWEASGHKGVYCLFDTSKERTVQLKLAVSFTGYDKACELLDKEIPDWNFDKVREAGRKAWNNKLSAIEVTTDSSDLKKIFYSALFRCLTLSRDRSEDNHCWESDLPFWDDNYAYWDTFRTAYPLLALIDPNAVRDNILAMIDRFDHNGCVYDGFIAGQERHMDQGGNDADIIIVDAFLKNIPGVDWENAYRIVKYNADSMRIGYRGNAVSTDNYSKYKELGWIPDCIMSTSQTLEFAYNDYCTGLMAEGLGHKEDAQNYFTRSHCWTNLWNPDLEDHGFKGHIDARRTDGTFAFVCPSVYGGSWLSPFYEADAWTYNYYVPHDFEKLIELMGGDSAFVDRLQYGLENNLPQFSNEPGFLVPRAFAHAGRPDLESVWVHHVMETQFDTTGYPGNDDTGAMGSWYVFCSLGLFPNAGQDIYYLNAPLFKKSEIHISYDKTLTIESVGNGKTIKSATLNGKEIPSPYILSYSDIKEGGHLVMELY